MEMGFLCPPAGMNIYFASAMFGIPIRYVAASLLPALLAIFLGTLKEFAILGWSFGGPLALIVAARIPSRVSAVLLCSTFVTPPHPALVPFRFAMTAPVIAADA